MALDREQFPGKTRMHAFVREFDWGASSLGPPASWPKSLFAIVHMMLDSAFPMCLSWGPELRFLYNDGYLPMVGQAHPAAFGAPMRDVWGKLWPAMEPIAQRALAGEPGFFGELPVEEVRHGRPSRRWFNLSCTPVHGDESRIAGVMCIGEETTEQILMERQQAFLLRLSDQLRNLSDADEITAHASRLLGLHLGASRVGYAEVHEAHNNISIDVRADWTSGELPALAGRTMTPDDFGPATIVQLRAGKILKVNDSGAPEDLALPPCCGSTGARSMVAVPLFRAARLCAVLYVHGAHARLWSEDEVALVEEAAEPIWAAVERANADERRRRAEEELHKNAARQAFQLELSDLLRPLTDPDAIIAAASGLLGRHLGVSRVLYAEVDEAKGTFDLQREWTGPGVARMATRAGRVDDFGPEILAALKSGSPVAIDDIARDPRTIPYGDAYTSRRAFLALPLVKAGRLTTVLVLHQAEPFHWKELDLQRAQDMAERTWSFVEAARAQAALRVERDRSQYVLDSMAEGFAILDPNCTVVQMNAEGLRIGHLTQAQVIGRKACDIWPDAAGSGLGDMYRRVKDTGKTVYLEYKQTLPDGQASWLEIRAYPALGGGVAVFYRDINQRKQAEEKLKEADRRKDEFVAMLAHELRNPIAPIAAAAEVLSMPGIDAADVKHTGEVIARQIGHMTDLVNDLLDISRITSGMLDLHYSRVDVNQIVPEAIEQAEPLIRAHAHHLTVHPAGEPALVWGDRHRLVQVLVNLLNNSAKYTPRGGSIAVQVDSQEKHVVLSVRDNGIGMPPHLVVSVFELFAQAQRTPERATGGLGIGLALVKGIVDLHGGTVSAYSAGIGLGSEFRVMLPRLATRDGPG